MNNTSRANLKECLLETHKLGVLQKLNIGYLPTSPRAQVHTSFPPYLGNGWMDCAEILCVVRGPLTIYFKVLRVECTVCACAHKNYNFPYLSKCWILCSEIWCVVGHALTMRFTLDGEMCTSTRAAVQSTLKHMHLLPLVHRPKRRLAYWTWLKCCFIPGKPHKL